ncbi:ABC transporter ATP-binding protein [Jiangella asiatica]|uniref:ABC transporter ATP-binding protein n=1 Tax=Jiangella asiatica TaxID=2530372 RepID=A0A4R5DDN0_9ACTN|nr:ABC transporter ATP-binding protein [Jiangella asiatica]TDE11167.1 ABC transporter ATP-binding protein [Jiangella asiatica]
MTDTVTVPLLSVENLKVRFATPEGLVTAVDGVDLQLGHGERLGIVGESGSGKSVLIRTIMGLYRPGDASIEGDVVFDGRRVLTMTPRERRRIWGSEIGMIFQDPMNSLHPITPVGAQIAEALRLHRGMTRKEAAERAVELLDLVKIADPRRRSRQRAHELSGGMRQRVMIAMAMACEPKLLLADEPTTALDVTVQARILELFDSLCGEFGIGLILVSHDLGVVGRHTDRVAVMYAGQVGETGSVRQVLERPTMRYTGALLDAAPRWGRDHQVLPTPIGGQPPNLLTLGPGCHFAPRCPGATDRCREARPALVAVPGQPEHRAACWHPIDAPDPAEREVTVR